MSSGRSLAAYAGSHPHQEDQPEAVNTKPGCRAIRQKAHQGRKLTVEWSRGAVIVSEDGRRFLKIKASHGMHIATGTRIDGNFLAAGDHWQRLLDAGRPPIRAAFPDGLPLDKSLMQGGVTASHKIYGQRSVA